MNDSRLGTRFWTLWTSFSASNLGDGLSLVALPLLAISETGDARLIALVAAVRVLPFLVLGLPAGVVLDRFDRRRLALGAQILRSLAALGLAAITIAGDLSILALIVASVILGAGEVMIDGSLPAITRDVVRNDQLEVANARIAAAQTVTNLFIGPPLGALLFEIDPSLPLIVIGVLFVAGSGLLTRLPGEFRAEQPADDVGEGFRTAIAVGLRYVWAHDVLRPLALSVALFSFVGEAGNAVFVILATERFGLESIGFGFLLAADGVAAVVMSFFVARLVATTSHSWSMRFSVVTYCVGALMFGFTTAVAAAFIASSLQGLSGPTWNIVSATARQRLVPDAVFGRMITAYLFIAWGMQPLGALLGGVIAEQWGPEWVFVLSGLAVGSLFFTARPMFRALDQAMAA